jgi:hypothetical protein
MELKLGTCRYEWFNAAKGEDSETGSIRPSGGVPRFKASFDGGAVLCLRAEP